MWKGKFLQGSSHCEIHIHIYTELPLTSYIIEANRVKGDSKPFFAFYKDFKSMFTEVPDNKPVNSFYFQPLPSTKTTDEQFLGGIKPIFVMASEPYFESRLESAKMLCDLSQHPQRALIQLPECKSQCIASLEKLVSDDFDYVRQHAMCAFAMFVEVPGYQELMVKSSAMCVLFNHIDNPQEPAYETIQSRRECSRILAALTKYDAASVMLNLQKHGGSRIVEDWLARVDGIKDMRLKYQADVVRKHIREAQTSQQQKR